MEMMEMMDADVIRSSQVFAFLPSFCLSASHGEGATQADAANGSI